MLNQFKSRFSRVVPDFTLSTSTASLDARLKLLERQGRSAVEEARARSIEAQLFSEPALLDRAKERLSMRPAGLARHIFASLLGAAMVLGVSNPVLADPPPPNSVQEESELPQIIEVIEELLDEVVELLTSQDPDPEEGIL